ncbi:hypothetical protein UR09_00935 [Candidatus Nitromaritima sp. SCGC AAA799-A02]|nr:hypothetical protein UZ36_06860 [Candidatus Nitromaritima sp. SCGC AAA799-C22]KMP12619.1 hypothetical protein UR09_00935 [Candidatus Nitromaritima sp. SCGC AAA799-A02]
MKFKIPDAFNILLFMALTVVLTAASGCSGYPKAEHIQGSMNTDVNYEVMEDTAVINQKQDPGTTRWWVSVDCDHWAGCFMRCDGTKSKCRKLAEDAGFKMISMTRY